MPWIDGVHCKDGRWPPQEGQLREETSLGDGDVDLRAWLKRLLELGYRGPLTIEREISGEQQKQDILRAVALLEALLRDFSYYDTAKSTVGRLHDADLGDGAAPLLPSVREHL
jgi:L-ribulose-5-phosphate 3-epimerase UlaE